MIDTDDGVSLFRVVSAQDPAIDSQRTDRKRYAETRDASLLHFLPSQRPRWFVLRALTIDDMFAIEKAIEPNVKFMRAVMFGLDAVEGHLEDGSALRPTMRVPDGGRGGDRTIWGTDEFQRLFASYGMTVIYELGVLLYERAFRGNAWTGGADFYTVPPVLSEGLERIARRHAE